MFRTYHGDYKIHFDQCIMNPTFKTINFMPTVLFTNKSNVLKFKSHC